MHGYVRVLCVASFCIERENLFYDLTEPVYLVEIGFVQEKAFSVDK